jgi:hypothetical protein
MDEPELLAKVGSMTAPFSNWVCGIPFAKRIMEAVVGVHRKARLPAFHRRTFKQWIDRRD